MELQGKVIAALPQRSGTSARGEWKTQDFVIETHDSYPKKLVFTVFGAERLDRFNIQIGQEITVFFDIDAHEWNGRWFNDIRAYDIRQTNPAEIGMMTPPPAPYMAQPGAAPQAAPAAAAAPQAAAPQQPAADPFAGGGSDDDLPF